MAFNIQTPWKRNIKNIKTSMPFSAIEIKCKCICFLHILNHSPINKYFNIALAFRTNVMYPNSRLSFTNQGHVPKFKFGPWAFTSAERLPCLLLNCSSKFPTTTQRMLPILSTLKLIHILSLPINIFRENPGSISYIIQYNSLSVVASNNDRFPHSWFHRLVFLGSAGEGPLVSLCWQCILNFISLMEW